MEIKKVLLVKYGEISLRKGNRQYFENVLLEIIRSRLIGLGGKIKVRKEQGRFLIEDLEADLNTEEVLPRIQKIFGIIGFCHAIKTTSRDTNSLCKTAVQFIKTIPNLKSFKVKTKRSDKSFPHKSMDISAQIGEAILNETQSITVDIHKPEVTLYVEIRNDVYFYVDSVNGEGGLPYGSSGKGILLMSGGFDSPVAGYLTARRGVEIVPVYFHSPPFVSERAEEKVIDLSKRLADFTGKIKLYIIPFTDTQVFLKNNVSDVKLTIFLKRAMLHIANKIAEEEKALCLITGDSIGQVASQTISSLSAMESTTDLPIIRPLATMDKQAIIEKSVEIGTHDISIRPYDDCCTVFVAKHPENKPNKNAIQKIESRFIGELLRLADEAIANAKILKL